MHLADWSFWGMHALWWLFWIVVVIGFVATLASGERRQRHRATPLEIPQRRYAAGEIKKKSMRSKSARSTVMRFG